MAFDLRYAARSDVGIVRTSNEDSGYAGPWLLVVADGMGGHAAGELASAATLATFSEVADSPLPEDEALSMLADGVDLSGERIGDFIAAQPQFQGMGTTLTALAWLGDRLALVHVGDSRAYLLREGELHQITKDHTYVQTLVDSGRITAEEATTHPRRNLIMKAIDGIHPVDPDMSVRDLRAGDRYLLCSDGLTGVVSDATIAEVLSSNDPTGAVTRLVDLALAGGAPDNVTVVVADIVEVGENESAHDELPVVVGAAAEPRVRQRLPQVPWPVDQQIDPEAAADASATVTHDTAPQPPITGVADDEAPTSDAVDAGGDGAGKSRSSRLVKIVALVLGFVLVIFALFGMSFLWWLNDQWFVGEYEGNVAIYQGVPGDLAGVPLNRLEQETGIAVDTLPDFDQGRVRQSIVVSSRDQAVSTVAELDARSQACSSTSPPEGCPVSEEPVPAVSASPTSGASL